MSHFPTPYCGLGRVCMGVDLCLRFVSALHIPAFNRSLLVSGGGDPGLKVWDWMTGKEKHDIPIREAVEPFIVVKGKKRRWFEEEMGGENSTARVRKKGRKGKAKEVPVQDVHMEEAGGGGSPTPPIPEDALEDGPQESIRPEVEELVLVIHKIDSFETPRGKYLVFSAVGYVFCLSPLCTVPSLSSVPSCTSLFACAFPSQDDALSPMIRTFDLHKPVIDFHIHDSLFWVLVDDGWSEESLKLNPVQCVRWSSESQEVGHGRWSQAKWS